MEAVSDSDVCGVTGGVTTIVAEALTDGALVADAVAVFLRVRVVVQLVLVALEMCTLADTPAAMLPKLQLSTWEPTAPLMAQVPGPP